MVANRETLRDTTPDPDRPLGRVTLGRFYNPHYGYQPYWPGGDWKKEDDPDATTTSETPQVCGRDCHYLYVPIKEICARNNDKLIYDGCWSYYNYQCKGWPPDSLKRGYETFDTYCEFLDYQCQSRGTGRHKTVMNRWTFVHVGACVDNQAIAYKPVYSAWEPISRLKFYLSSQSKTFENLSKKPC